MSPTQLSALKRGRASERASERAGCVQRFDNTLDSAIHTKLSHIAASFIDREAKTSTVMSCAVLHPVFVCLGRKRGKKGGLLNRGSKTLLTCPRAYPRQAFMLHYTSFDDDQSSKTLEMIQLQVHLQLPCYDFCFLY